MPDEDVATELFRRFLPRLTGLVRRRLSGRLQRRIDPEDVVQSAYRSFFVRLRAEKSAPEPSTDHWPLLATIAVRKLARQIRRHRAAGRTFEREISAPGDEGELFESTDGPVEFAIDLQEQIAKLSAQLDPTAREILVRALQRRTPAEVADSLQITERTVRRAIARIRSRFQRRLETSPLETSFLRQSASRLASPSPALPVSSEKSNYRNYRLQEFLGSGGFGKVYRALDLLSRETVAVKFLRKECWNDSRAIATFLREFQLLMQLHHPHILRVRAWGTTPYGAAFLVSEYVAGQNLDEWRTRSQPTFQQLIGVLQQIAEGVAAAHDEGILHCDLKPANVRVQPNGRAVLCDFGLARYAATPDDVPLGGTAGFLAPEQISAGSGPITARTDVYGWGACSYSLLTGVSPMQGRDLAETLERVLSTRQPHPLWEYDRQIPEALERLVLRCLAKQPAERPVSMAEVTHELGCIAGATSSRV